MASGIGDLQQRTEAAVDQQAQLSDPTRGKFDEFNACPCPGVRCAGGENSC
ncbi:MAG: hypothetical protein GX755_09475 [Syntrophomonadaceae bacterium]|nr:hypothetical protein [Syntrophomonadaceae bacterium]